MLERGHTADFGPAQRASSSLGQLPKLRTKSKFLRGGCGIKAAEPSVGGRSPTRGGAITAMNVRVDFQLLGFEALGIGVRLGCCNR